METVNLGNIMIDTNNTEQLQNFYANLFGWEKCKAFGDLGVRIHNGILILFNYMEYFKPAVYPNKPGQSQRQMHLDVQVANVDKYVERALILGAKLADIKYVVKDYITILDPCGHPICLCYAGNLE